MDTHDPLMTGMFWGGLLVAAIPILLTLGIGFLVLRKQIRGHGQRPAAGSVDPPPEE